MRISYLKPNGGRPAYPAACSAEPPVRVENAWPAIISRETFQLVQRKMASRRPQVTHPRTVPSFYLLSGLLFCSCGRAMIGRSAKSHQYYYYMCSRSFKQGKDVCDAKILPKDKLSTKNNPKFYFSFLKEAEALLDDNATHYDNKPWNKCGLCL